MDHSTERPGLASMAAELLLPSPACPPQGACVFTDKQTQHGDPQRLLSAVSPATVMLTQNTPSGHPHPTRPDQVSPEKCSVSPQQTFIFIVAVVIIVFPLVFSLKRR